LLQGIEWFQVDDVRVEGARMLGPQVIERALALAEDASIWDDLTILAKRVERTALVEQARIRRDFPSTLVVEVTEAEAVALIATPTLAPIDRSGRLLPVDPARNRLDLPLLTVSLEPGSANYLTSRDLRGLLSEWVHLRELDPEFAARVSQVGIDDHGAMVVRLVAPNLTLRYRPPATQAALRAGLEAMRRARSSDTGSAPVELDLRFDGQVVLRYPSELGTET